MGGGASEIGSIMVAAAARKQAGIVVNDDEAPRGSERMR